MQGKEHLNDELIKTLIISKSGMNFEIEKHLTVCSYCKERFEYYAKYFKNVDELLAEPAGEMENELAEKIKRGRKKLIPEQTTYQFVKQLESDSKFGLVKKAYQVQNFIKRKPITAAAGFTGFAALITFMLIAIVKPGYVKNVSAVEAQNGFLIAYDDLGEKYWAKYIGQGFDRDTLDKTIPNLRTVDFYKVIDLDNDGINEVLVTSSQSKDSFREKRKFLCLNADGSLKWSFTYHNVLNTEAEVFADEYIVDFFKVFDLNSDGKNELYVVALLNNFFPAFIVQLNPETGEKISEYYHPGYLNGLLEEDIDGDGIKELIAYGQSNSYDKGVLLALKFGKITGSAPVDETRKAMGINPADEVKYILFPRNFPLTFSKDRINPVTQVEHIDPDLYTLKVAENIADLDTQFPHYIIYKLDKNFNFISVETDDVLKLYLDKLQNLGNLPFKFDQSYLDSLGKQIVYLK